MESEYIKLEIEKITGGPWELSNAEGHGNLNTMMSP